MQACTLEAVNTDFTTSILHIAFVVQTCGVDIGGTADGDGTSIGQRCRRCTVPEAHVACPVYLNFGTSVVVKRGFIDDAVLTRADIRASQNHTVVCYGAEVVHAAGRRASGPFEGEATGGRDGECRIGIHCDGFGHCRRADDWVVGHVGYSHIIGGSGYGAVVPVARSVPVGGRTARPDVASGSGQNACVVGDNERAAVEVLDGASVGGDVAVATGIFDDGARVGKDGTAIIENDAVRKYLNQS